MEAPELFETFQGIEKNTLKVVKALVEDGAYPGSLPELGMYAYLCGLRRPAQPTPSQRHGGLFVSKQH